MPHTASPSSANENHIYRQPLQQATLYVRDEGGFILFDEPQRGITPGQFAAWYDGEELVGSGVIDR